MTSIGEVRGIISTKNNIEIYEKIDERVEIFLIKNEKIINIGGKKNAIAKLLWQMNLQKYSKMSFQDMDTKSY